jgi:hypothetical protein
MFESQGQNKNAQAISSNITVQTVIITIITIKISFVKLN